jgi:transposase
MSDLFWFSDEQWARIEPLLPNKSRGVPRVDDRRVLSGIVHALRCGGRWSDCPPEYGPRKTLYNRFVRWADNGTWERIFHALAADAELPGRLFIDATLIKAHRTAGGAKGGAWPMVSAVPRTDVRAKSTPYVMKWEDRGHSF